MSDRALAYIAWLKLVTCSSKARFRCALSYLWLVARFMVEATLTASTVSNIDDKQRLGLHAESPGRTRGGTWARAS